MNYSLKTLGIKISSYEMRKIIHRDRIQVLSGFFPITPKESEERGGRGWGGEKEMWERLEN